MIERREREGEREREKGRRRDIEREGEIRERQRERERERESVCERKKIERKRRIFTPETESTILGKSPKRRNKA